MKTMNAAIDTTAPTFYMYVCLVIGIYFSISVIPATLRGMRSGEMKTFGRGTIMRSNSPGKFWFSVAMGFGFPLLFFALASLIYAAISAVRN
jgi:hypothetical protein